MKEIAGSRRTAPGNRAAAQSLWSHLPLTRRLEFIETLRRIIAENANLLATASALVSRRPVAEKLVSEVLPLADGCRWLERNAERVLSVRRFGRRGRPLWLCGVDFQVQRQPLGDVLVIGPRNVPLFLPAIQALQALVAGNSVRLKPAPGTRHVAATFAGLAFEAGLDPVLLEILDDTDEAAQEAITDGVDKVVFTGSSEHGREVLTHLAETSTPAVMELSGDDAVIVLADADLELVVRALRFGLRLNDGNTCMVPRKLIVIESVCSHLAAYEIPIPIVPVLTEGAAVGLVNAGEFGLGASIFSRDIAKARALAAEIKSGFVLINDLIVPTADPRMPFGGVKASGFGSTRGEEGLLEMTFPHVVAVRRGKFYQHFAEATPTDARLFSAWIRVAHGYWSILSLRTFAQAILARSKKGRKRT